MTKIYDLINFYPGYGEQVRLVASFYNENNPTENSEHVRGYVPIRSHRQAFMDLAQAQLPSAENKGKVFMLTGSYGTGKSHLCLMLANYFSLKPTDPEMREFFDNWSGRDPLGAEKVRNWRGGGRYLVAPCDFMSKGLFEDVLLTAVLKALELENAQEIILDTHFKAALRMIETWEQRQQAGKRSGAFDDFLSFLGGGDPQEELDTLKDNLRKNKSAAMELFQETYEKAASQRLAFRNDSLQAVLKDLLANPEFQKRYKGLVILADEFGYALDGLVNMGVFHGFAEMSRDGVAGMQLIFVGVIHRRFGAYANNPSLQDDFRVVQDRITEVSLDPEELEQIIAHLISPKTEAPAWEQEVQKKNAWLLTQMSSNARKFGLFKELSEPEVLNQIVRNIYPAHPMAVYCLTRMSQELGSKARTVFAFFREFGAEPPEGSYSWFVRNNEITRPNGELNIYTPELLAVYFKPSITTSEPTVRKEIRDLVRNYLAAVEEARRFAYKNTLTKELAPFTQRVLDLIFVYRCSKMNVTPQTLEYGLNLIQPSDKKALTSELKSLSTNKIIFQSPSGEYEFRHSDMEDWDTLIEQSLQDILSQPLHLSMQAMTLAKGKWEPFTEAKGHNQAYLGDKRLRRVLATPQELSARRKQPDGSEESFWISLEQQRKTQPSWGDGYDGAMVFVLCENEADIQLAQQVVKSNHCPNIIVGIPKTPIPLKKALTDLLAVQNFMETETYKKLGFQEQSMVSEILGKEGQKTGRVGAFITARERYLEVKGLHWYREDGKTLVADPLNEYDPADALMNRLFTQRNTVSHDYLSKAHPKSFSGSKDAALRDAVARLVDTNRPVQIDHAEKKEQRGEYRYLKMALANHGVLQQVGDYDGNVASYELERNPAKYQHKYPGLAHLIDCLKGLQRGQKLVLWETLAAMTDDPYGLGPYALAIFTACAVRHFGDELRLKLNPTGLGYSALDDAENIIDLATGKFLTATLERRLLNPPTARLINEVYNLFAALPAPAGVQQTLSEAWHALLGWWKVRTRLERAVGIYADDSTTCELVDLLAKNSENNTGSQVFLEELKRIYGYDPDADLDDAEVQEITKRLGADKTSVEQRAGQIKISLIDELSALFQPQGDSYQAYKNAIIAWYEGLHPDQKLLTADWQTESTRAVLEAVQKLQDVEKTFLETVPASYGFKLAKVDDWSYDQSSTYFEIFKNALERIEDSLPKVPPPIWLTSIQAGPLFKGQSEVKYHGSVKLSVESPGEEFKVRVTMNEDPRPAKQFITVEKDRVWETQIIESCSYWLVTQDGQGDFSAILRIVFTNLDEGYKLIAEGAPKLDPAERLFRFRNPVDKSGLVVLLKDMIDHFQRDQLIPPGDILAAFVEAMKSKLSDNQGDKTL